MADVLSGELGVDLFLTIMRSREGVTNTNRQGHQSWAVIGVTACKKISSPILVYIILRCGANLVILVARLSMLYAVVESVLGAQNLNMFEFTSHI